MTYIICVYITMCVYYSQDIGVYVYYIYTIIGVKTGKQERGYFTSIATITGMPDPKVKH